MIDRLTIERIKDTADIVDVVSEFVSLKRSGSNYKGLCPFHNDRTPSFYVSPSRGTCKCFTCGEGGDSVGFLMKHEQMTYPEALRWLAKRYNIEIEERERTDAEKQQMAEREGMLIINKWVAEYYSNILNNDIDGRAVGMQYFRQRGIRDDIVEKFRLGFAPADKYAMAREAKAKGYNTDYLLKTGICYQDNKGQLVDRFFGRVMFPWIGISGNVVAFGGRVLDQATKGVNQKYVNSPDSPVYHKDHELYGIFQAKKAISKQECVYMVEGYTDVIAMHQCGIENVVANSGTALSVHQIKLLHRFTSNIVLLYDGDDAGIHAALRGTDMLLAEGMNVKVLLFPDGDDPDSFSRKHNAEQFRQYIEDHQTDFIEFKTQVLLRGVTDPIKRSEAISSIVKSVSVISDPIIRATYIKDCSSRLGINEMTLITTMNEFIRSYREERRKESQRRERGVGDGAAPDNVAQAVQGQGNNISVLGENTQIQGVNAKIQGANQTVSQPSASPTSQPSTVTSAGMDPYDDIPPEAFLPPEAFNGAPIGPGDAYSSQGNVASNQGVAPQSYATPTYSNQGYGAVSTTASTASKPKTSVHQLDVQTMLIQAVMRYGDRVVVENAETDDGQLVTFNVAQYVKFDLGCDELSFRNPLYNQILEEAVAKSEEEGFAAERYFLHHADYEISKLALELCDDPVILSKSYALERDEVEMREHVEHLLLDFRWEYVTERMNALMMDMRLCHSNNEKYLELLAEFQNVQKMRTMLGKRIGRT